MRKEEYLYLVKNLRGIIYFRKPLRWELLWLKRKVRYRLLGIDAKLYAKIKKPWKNLIPLRPKVERKSRKIRELAMRAIYLANRFLSPLIIVGKSSYADFKKLALLEIRTKAKFNDVELRRNLRLLDYAMTDCYVKSSLAVEKEKRSEIAKKDAKRFWRIKQEKDGEVFIAYLDPLLALQNFKCSIIPAIVLDFELFKAEEKRE